MATRRRNGDLLPAWERASASRCPTGSALHTPHVVEVRMESRMRTSGMLCLLSAATLTVALMPTSALADPGSGRSKGVPISRTEHAIDATPAALAILAAQAPLDKAADHIQYAAPDVNGSGFAGAVVDAGNRTLKLYWHGEMAPAAAKALSTERAHGVHITVTPADYTYNQLEAEAYRLADDALQSADSTASKLVAIGPKSDGSGLDVTVTGSATAFGPAALALHAKVPLSVSVSGGLTLDDRYADTYPWWGGSYIESGNVACTSGFGVTGNNGAAQYLITAAHCGNHTWTTGVGDTIGNSIVTTWSNEVQLIYTPQGSGSYVYDGDSVIGSNQFAKHVAGASTTRIGDRVCTSGAFTGAVCNSEVQAVGLSFNVDGHTVHGEAAA